MPRKLLEKTKNALRKPRRFGSQSRYRPSAPFVSQIKPVKENEEIEVSIDDIGSRGDGVARIEFPDLRASLQDRRKSQGQDKVGGRQVRHGGKSVLGGSECYED